MKSIGRIIKSKKGRLAVILLSALLIALAITGILHIKGCADRNAAIKARRTRLSEAAEGLNRYDVEITVLPDENRVSISEEVLFTNRTKEPLKDVIFRTWAGAFTSEDTSPAAIEEVFGETYGTVFSPGGIEILDIQINDEQAAFSFEDSACTVLNVNGKEIAPGETVKIGIRLSLTVPECAYRFGRTDDMWQLGNFIPLLDIWENGDWVRNDYYPIGDPFRSECANFNLKVTLPEEYTLLCSIPMDGKDGVWTGSLQAARDIALVIGKDLATEEADVNSIRVIAAAREKDEAEQILSFAEEILGTLEELYGPYPYPVLTLVACSLPADGMAYPALIMLGNKSRLSEEELEITVARQCAQQWFSVLVGTDGYAHPWQDEAVCEFAMLSCMEALHGSDYRQHLIISRVEASQQENILSSVTPGSPIDYFTYLTDYSSVVYDRGCGVLLSCDLMTGGGMNSFLRHYCEVYAFKEASRNDFEELLNTFTGMDLRPLLEDLDYLH